MELHITYAPGAVARGFHRDEASRVKLLIGPFGTGKTTSAAWDLIDFASDRVRSTNGKKKSRFAVVRNTYPELRDTTIKTYLDWFPPAAFGKYNSTEKRYTMRFENREIEILFKALDSPQDVRDLLSLELTGAHIDEARELHEDIFKGLLGRIGRYPSMKDTGGANPFLTPPQIILTTNYPSTEHWIYRDFAASPVSGYSIFRQSQDENRSNLRPGYYEDLERDYAGRPDLLKTLVRGEWGVTVRGRQVYPEFKRETHVAGGPLTPIDGPVIRGWDNTGLSPACVITQISSTGRWLVLKEFCGTDIGIMDFGEMVSLWCNHTFGANIRYRDIGDPAGNTRDTTRRSPADYLRKININVEDGIQTFKARRESVAGRLTKLVNGEAAMRIDPGCVRLIDGFDGGYAYPEVGNTGVFMDGPAKNEYSHIHDALQYAATRLFMNERKKTEERPRPRVYAEHGWMA